MKKILHICLMVAFVGFLGAEAKSQVVMKEFLSMNHEGNVAKAANNNGSALYYKFEYVSTDGARITVVVRMPFYALLLQGQQKKISLIADRMEGMIVAPEMNARLFQHAPRLAVLTGPLAFSAVFAVKRSEPSASTIFR